MMNSNIPVVLVFCLVAVSVSLAQPLVEQDVSDEWRSYIVNQLRIEGSESLHRKPCNYAFAKCVIKGDGSEQKCEFKNLKGGADTKDCPAPTSQSITFKLTGDNVLSYTGLKLENPEHHIPASAKGTIEQCNYRLSYVNFSPNYKMVLLSY
eukprot:Nk52_evm3s188 gene=Nk52_evmTU3s188